MTASADGFPPGDERSSARERVQAKRDWSTHLVVYTAVNAFLVVVWAISGDGFFWPAWSLAGWGIGLALHAWSVFGERPVTEADVDEELERGRTRTTRRSQQTL